MIPPIILHTCDAYQQYWEPWWRQFRKYVSGYQKIYFLTEEKEPSFLSEYHGLVNIKTGKGEWGSRLLIALNEIDEYHIFYMQEDFWAFKPFRLDHDLFDTFCRLHMDAMRISIKTQRFATFKPENGEYVQRFTRDSPYLMTHHFSLWDKEFFKKHILPVETPWENEINQSKIMRDERVNIYLWENHWYETCVDRGQLNDHGKRILNINQ